MTKQISPLRQRMIDDMAFRNMPGKRSPDGAQRNPGFSCATNSPGFRFASSGYGSTQVTSCG